jgi:hypothetical protein
MALKSSTRGKITVDSGPLAAPPRLEVVPFVRSRRERKTQVPASRKGLVPFGFFVPPEARMQIKGFAGLNGRTTQEIGQEMMDDWFVKHGMHRLAGSGDMPE